MNIYTQIYDTAFCQTIILTLKPLKTTRCLNRFTYMYKYI